MLWRGGEVQAFAQVLVLTRTGFSSIGHRIGASLVLIGSVACVIGVLLSMLSVTAGLLRAFRAGDDPALAIVLSPSNIDYGGGIPANAIGTILDAPGIATGSDGLPLGDAESVIWVPPSAEYVIGSPNLRGIGAAGLALRPKLTVVTGRMFRPGLAELIVGIAAARHFQLHVGDTIVLPTGSWPIVGAFSDDGSIEESELLGDAATLRAVGIVAGFSSVLVRLTRPEAFGTFEHWLTTNPTLDVNVERQSDYAVRTVNRAAEFYTELTYFVAVIMALGALFGIVKLTYAAASARTREIGTLRAIGYQPYSVAISLLLETAALSLTGALLGTGAAWLLFNGKHVAVLHNVFDLSVSPRLFALGLVWALALALLGALPPAIRAARASVVDALRAV
jgi:putative ABC transport system permease protein